MLIFLQFTHFEDVYIVPEKNLITFLFTNYCFVLFYSIVDKPYYTLFYFIYSDILESKHIKNYCASC